jgi:hypothetical protein
VQNPTIHLSKLRNHVLDQLHVPTTNLFIYGYIVVVAYLTHEKVEEMAQLALRLRSFPGAEYKKEYQERRVRFLVSSLQKLNIEAMVSHQAGGVIETYDKNSHPFLWLIRSLLAMLTVSIQPRLA